MTPLAERRAILRWIRNEQKHAHSEMEIAIYGQVIQYLLERGRKGKRK